MLFFAFTNPSNCIDILVRAKFYLMVSVPCVYFARRVILIQDLKPRLPLCGFFCLNLKLFVFSIPYLKQILKPIGRFLHVNAAIAKFYKPNVGKVKVVVDLLKRLRQKIFIRLGSN